MIEIQQPWAPALIVRLYVEEGHTARSIGQKLGITPQTIRRVLDHAGVKTRAVLRRAGETVLSRPNTVLQKVTPQEVLARYNAPRASMSSISKHYKVDSKSMRVFFLWHGLKMRSAKEQRAHLLASMTDEEKTAISRAAKERYYKSGRAEALEAAARTREITQATATPESREIANRLGDFHPILEMAVSRYNVDIGFPILRVAIELDGGGHHCGRRELLTRDQKKEFLLRRLGFVIFRIEGEEEVPYLRSWLTRIKAGAESVG